MDAQVKVLLIPKWRIKFQNDTKSYRPISIIIDSQTPLGQRGAPILYVELLGVEILCHIVISFNNNKIIHTNWALRIIFFY